MKVGIILLLSKYLSKYYLDVKKTKYFILLSIIVIFVFLLIMLQPDFGTGLVIVLFGFGLMVLGFTYIILYINLLSIGYNFLEYVNFIFSRIECYFVIIGLIGLLGIGGLIISAPYRFERIIAYLDPWSDPLGSGFQGIQSLFAITPGGLFGHGFNNSIQKHFFLPEPQNDFIYAIVVEEFGLIGGAIVLGLYLLIICNCFKISKKIDNNYCKFIIIGLSLTLAIQVFINVGVVIGLLPVTGITLPLFSYGGSSLLINYISFGLILNASKHQNI